LLVGGCIAVFWSLSSFFVQFCLLFLILSFPIDVEFVKQLLHIATNVLQSWQHPFSATVWWGHKPLMAKDLSNIPGVNTHHQNHPKKLFISGLSKISTEPQVDLRRAELERAFRRYGGAHGITATVTKNCTFAFVEVDTERHADMALAEMTGQYRINRARRTKHEALMERRALEEAAGQGVATTQTKNEWG